jgi:hypothetical protein
MSSEGAIILKSGSRNYPRLLDETGGSKPILCWAVGLSNEARRSGTFYLLLSTFHFPLLTFNLTFHF